MATLTGELSLHPVHLQPAQVGRPIFWGPEGGARGCLSCPIRPCGLPTLSLLARPSLCTQTAGPSCSTYPHPEISVALGGRQGPSDTLRVTTCAVCPHLQIIYSLIQPQLCAVWMDVSLSGPSKLDPTGSREY